MMVPQSSRRDDDLLTCDLETGATSTSNDEEWDEDPPISVSVSSAKKCLNRVWSGILHVDERPSSSYSTCSAPENVDDNDKDKSSGGEDNVGLLRYHLIKDKRKRASAKKPPKPPRPPGSPSLGVADQKLVRELSELAMLKRARMDRMRAHKKMGASKSSSSSSSSSTSSLCAMLITIIFCLVILFQGMFSSSSSKASIEVSPVSSISSTGPLISVQYYKNPRASSSDLGTESPNLVEQVSGADPDEERNRVAG